MEWVIGLGIIFMMIVLIQTEQIYKEQKRHHKQLEKILKEQTELLSKIEQENRLIRIALHRPKIEALYDELKQGK